MRTAQMVLLLAIASCFGEPERIEGTEPGDCTDDADNDADSLFDCDDPGCAGAAAATVDGNTVTKQATVKPVLHFWRQSRAGSEDPELEDGSRNYNQVVRGIDFDLGSGNSGAVAVRHGGAEGSAIQNITVKANGAFAGFYNYPGSGGYAANIEVRGGPMTELNGVSNVTFYGQKTETIIPGTETKHEDNFGSPWPILMSIQDSNNVQIYGEEGPSQAESGRGLFEVKDSSDITIVNVGRRGRGEDAYYPEKSWYFVKEDKDGTISTIDATGLVGLFRRE